MDVLEVWFRFSRQPRAWEVQIVQGQKTVHSWRTWREPDRKEDLFPSLFHHAPELIGSPAHLRLRRCDSTSEYGELPDARWSELIHPTSEAHILDLNWTAAELVAPIRTGVFSGDIAVRGDSQLTLELRQHLGPCVQSVDNAEPPSRSILVIGQPTLDEEGARAIQQQARRANCPLVIWCAVTPPRSELGEVVPVAYTAASQPQAQWLSTFLSLLIAGHPPEQAFAEAGLYGPPEDRRVRWLRGAWKSWEVRARRPVIELPADWFTRLDRSKQEKRLNQLADGLVRPGSRRRVQVILTPGPDGSGLAQFRKRRPSLPADLALIEWSNLGWAENLEQQHKTLLWPLRAHDLDDLSHRMLSEAAREHRVRFGRDGQRVLFLLSHDTVTVQPGRFLRRISLDALSTYLADLQTLAQLLEDREPRVLVHLSIEGATEAEMRPLERQEDGPYRANVLAELGRSLPQDELGDWLNDYDLPHTQEELQGMVSLSYDELVYFLNTRYRRELGIV